MPEIVRINRIGLRGDGIAETPAGLVFVPFALPGEKVAIERDGERGRLIDIVAPSPERAAAICPHFGLCGGCSLQMMPLPATRELKRGFVATALSRAGVATPVEATIGVSVASRRRAVLTTVRTKAGVTLGFNERLSNRVVDVSLCPVLMPALAARLDGIRQTLAPLLPAGRRVRLTALLTKSGLDLDLEGPAHPGGRALPGLVELAGAHGIARVSINGEPIVTLAEPMVEVAGVPLTPPPGAFLQASAEAEAVMSGLVVEHLATCRRVADLFSGIGTFALALARHASIRAVEANQPALDALKTAERRARGLKRIDTERRDLFAFPLAAPELADFDGVVFDPPRAGARAQAEALAASTVPRIAAISCNPATFARDARILTDGGYVLQRVVPVDQFVYSAATEVVGLFARGR
jgi:23S rRNA (uracil1939-C5)-methyltransferase